MAKVAFSKREALCPMASKVTLLIFYLRNLKIPVLKYEYLM